MFLCNVSPQALAAWLFVAVLAVPAQAEESQRDRRGEHRRSQASRDSETPSRRYRRITGKVERTKQVDLRGSRDKELVVMLRTTAGDKQVVDLGATRKLGRHRVRTGDRISVEGRLMRIGDFEVLVAYELRQGGEGPWFTIERPRHPRTMPRNYSVAEQTRKVQGRILDTRRVTLRNSDDQHLVARVRDNSGKLRVVDFGNVNGSAAKQLDEGDRVTIHGRDMLVDGRKVLLAFKVVGENDESIQITREHSTGRSRR